MGMKVCIEPDCWVATAGARCPEHERAWQQRRNKRRGAQRTRHADYRKVSVSGLPCVCCGTFEDVTRHHVTPLALNSLTSVVVPMCRVCNSSIGPNLMRDHKCPMHGGEIQ